MHQGELGCSMFQHSQTASTPGGSITGVCPGLAYVFCLRLFVPELLPPGSSGIQYSAENDTWLYVTPGSPYSGKVPSARRQIELLN